LLPMHYWLWTSGRSGRREEGNTLTNFQPNLQIYTTSLCFPVK
jgi:hypothetical protein